MKIAFTICSNNYLGQAKSLADSLLQFNPDYTFFIGLVDRKESTIDYSFFHPCIILPVEELPIPKLDIMIERYNITELNTAVKPFIFKYLFDQYKEAETIIYFDPDILIYSKFEELEEALSSNNMVLTPHFTTPINDGCYPSEQTILNAGLYNLGFIALKKGSESIRFLDWWGNNLIDKCYIAFEHGLFTDQIWINFAPLYFKDVYILRHKGYNAAYWNLHERVVNYNDGKFWINNDEKLVFFHFSGYLFSEKDEISKYQTRFSFSSRNDVVPLFNSYQSVLASNNHLMFSKHDCYFVKKKKEKDLLAKQNFIKENTLTKRIIRFSKRNIKKLLPFVD